jgi:acetylornithine deacetylase
VHWKRSPGHAQAASAITAAQGFVDDLQTLTRKVNEQAKNHEWFGDIEKPVKFSLGKIRGGDWLGSVPSWCEIECRLSVLPGHSNQEVRRWIEDCINQTARRMDMPQPELSWIGFRAEGHVFAPGTDAEAVLGRCHDLVFSRELAEFCMTATSDTRNYDLYYDIPTLCYGGIGEGLHAPNECADLESMKQTTRVIALFIARWCGLVCEDSGTHLNDTSVQRVVRR